MGADRGEESAALVGSQIFSAAGVDQACVGGRVVCGRGRNTTISVPTPGTARRIALIWGRVEDLPWWRTKCDSARAGPEDPFGPLAPRPANGPYGGISRSLGRKIEFQAAARAVQIRLS